MRFWAPIIVAFVVIIFFIIFSQKNKEESKRDKEDKNQRQKGGNSKMTVNVWHNWPIYVFLGVGIFCLIYLIIEWNR